MLSKWRRVLEQGDTSELTLNDAAALLSSSLDMVQSQVDAGEIRARRGGRGRIHVSASVTYTPDGEPADDTVDTETLARMWNEMRSLQEQLNQSRAEEARLLAELDAAEKALAYTKNEVANLWHVMTTRNLKQAARKATEVSHETAKVLNLAEQRTRIRTKVADVREIARRRRWPWIGLVG